VAIRPGQLPDTPEEHKRRGDAAVALFHEIVRKITVAEEQESLARLEGMAAELRAAGWTVIPPPNDEQ